MNHFQSYNRVRRAILWARMRIAYWRAYESLTVWQASLLGAALGASAGLFIYYFVAGVQLAGS